jgi:DNA-binding GntR family transcriptional regulator
LSVVREALSRLVAEGWVEAQDRRGFRVAPVSIPELRDINISRIEIEKVALRQSITLGGPEWEDGVRRTYDNLNSVQRASPGDPGPLFVTWTDLHQKFHAALLSACPAGWLLKFRDILFQKCERYRFLSYSLASRDVEDEHRRIMETTLDRDIDAAIAALSDHYTRTAEIIIRGLSDIGSGDRKVSEK